MYITHKSTNKKRNFLLALVLKGKIGYHKKCGISFRGNASLSKIGYHNSM